mmetsp:Transcript_35272/g.35931  ORF Transcript_35272/g.35931 Transcript_35272/m.35931 type:complete len:197 (+) Transcript_35272:48-638(+)|eukprot:CAMPEP_0182426792 /NCGR_PEP_ID=MMETSP1167-20130531/13312_1 /TAXON_ID=2988 /ORGANISM="Mallomonas Sp, Strain CCMP3275" /LENGTH=196 /DNA_ID=CAMNT_0024608481 /DNA_START=41 /DNA_END=634 /DNA_ORIENTATION=-
MLTTRAFWEKYLSKATVDRIRRVILYKPDDPYNLWQMPPAQVPDDEVERIKGFRYPAPGSRVGARVPIRENEEQVYDIKHYSRDSRNLQKTDELYINASSKPTLTAPLVPRIGSPGSKNPAVESYDPSGLRTTMTANWASLDKALAENAAPNHLVTPEWEKDIEKIWAECDRKGIPRVVGRRMYNSAPASYNEIRW